ncbi:AraC family transcriptional regulator [Proteiniphilum sp. X52]|uniref:AraC family transcriptional regulator n=1 Tax=Proteiniphilum sp. X52 TaxID=2382159 RepID=UPI000F09E6AD|nr:helix-turn-helix domain-containing protein [Proteiniphilum sp. X52]RNC63332.1 AraC family transcriptional regulator [Proteiniphilum sp. X52]
MSETIQLTFICIFALDMYTLNEYLPIFVGKDLPEKGWDDGMYCLETNASKILRANLTQGFVSCFAFMLVDKGWMTIHYNGRELTLHPSDLYTYSPCLPVTVTATSDDFHGYCLMADEHAAIDAPVLHDLVHIATLPVVQLREPKQTLPDDAARHLAEKMCEIIHYQHSDHIYKGEVLRMLYAIFLLDLQNVQDRTIVHRQLSQRVEDIFIGFIRLLPDHFIEHHDIPFYASRLCISPVYLSRVVRQVSGRTVIDYINYMLLMEASFLLRTSKMSIAQISNRLHFSDTSSFSKFFSRMKGLSPREYREL